MSCSKQLRIAGRQGAMRMTRSMATTIMRNLRADVAEVGWTIPCPTGSFDLSPAFYTKASLVRDLLMDDQWMGEIMTYRDESIIAMHRVGLEGDELYEEFTDEADLIGWLERLKFDGSIQTYELLPLSE